MDLHTKLLGEGLAKNGHSVQIVSSKHPDLTEFTEKNGVFYHHLKDTVYGSRRHGWAQKSIDKYLQLHAIKPFDLLWSQSFDAYGVTRLHPGRNFPPVMLRLAGSVVQEFQSYRSNFFLHLKEPAALIRATLGLLFSYFVTQRPLMAYSDAIIAVSRVVVNDIQRWFGKRFAAKCRVINNGIDTEKFKPDPALRRQIRQQYGIGADEKLLLSLGRITHEKGHYVAIQSIMELARRGHNVKLMIAGDGPVLDDLKHQIKSRGLSQNIIFTGYIENDRTAGFYNAADIFLMPTLTVEGLPFTLLEAMACAKPVIASRIGGNLTLIENQVNGLFVSPGSVGDLSDKIQFLLSKDISDENLSSEARRTVLSGYSIEKMTRDYLEVMEALVRKRQII